jgi:hypothetical protein
MPIVPNFSVQEARKMTTVLRIRILDRDQAIDGLTRLRQEWQEAAGGDLVDVKASVGELLGDVMFLVGLTDEEQRAALGSELYDKLKK